jgi:hypothetical protein
MLPCRLDPSRILLLYISSAKSQNLRFGLGHMLFWHAFEQLCMDKFEVMEYLIEKING